MDVVTSVRDLSGVQRRDDGRQPGFSEGGRHYVECATELIVMRGVKQEGARGRERP